jgi:nitrite reductase (NO-forming)
MANTTTVPLPGRAPPRERRAGPLVAALALGTSLLVLTPLTLFSLRREALSVREGPAATVEVVADGMRFVPAEIRVPAGANVRLDLVDQDPSTPHDLQTFGQRRDVRVIAWPGERRSTVFKAADRPGRYVFVCTLRGHSAAGMAGTIIVQ